MNYRSQTVSAVLLTHNNASVLERALESLKWADEIVVVDRGSTDETLAIARRYTKHVFFHPSQDDYVLRRFALDKATRQWVLWLEPFEWVEEMLRHKIDGILLNPGTDESFAIAVHPYWQGQRLPVPPRQEIRLFRREQGAPLDHILFRGFQPTASITALDEAIGAEPFCNLCELTERMEDHAARGAYHLLESQGNQIRRLTGLMTLMFHPAWTWVRHALLKRGYTKGFTGLLIAYAESYRCFLKYARLRMLCAFSAS